MVLNSYNIVFQFFFLCRSYLISLWQFSASMMPFSWNSRLMVEFISCWKFEFQNQPKNLAIFILVNEPVKITYIIGIRDFFFNLYPCQGKINQDQIQWWSLSLNSSLGQKFVKFSHFPFFCIKPRKLKNMKKFNLISGSESKENYFKSFNSRAKIIIYLVFISCC